MRNDFKTSTAMQNDWELETFAPKLFEREIEKHRLTLNRRRNH